VAAPSFEMRAVRAPQDEGGAKSRAGYTLTILRKQPDGRWLLARDANLLTVQT